MTVCLPTLAAYLIIKTSGFDFLCLEMYGMRRIPTFTALRFHPGLKRPGFQLCAAVKLDSKEQKLYDKLLDMNNYLLLPEGAYVENPYADFQEKNRITSESITEWMDKELPGYLDGSVADDILNEMGLNEDTAQELMEIVNNGNGTEIMNFFLKLVANFNREAEKIKLNYASILSLLKIRPERFGDILAIYSMNEEILYQHNMKKHYSITLDRPLDLRDFLPIKVVEDGAYKKVILENIHDSQDRISFNSEIYNMIKNEYDILEQKNKIIKDETETKKLPSQIEGKKKVDEYEDSGDDLLTPKEKEIEKVIYSNENDTFKRSEIVQACKKICTEPMVDRTIKKLTKAKKNEGSPP